MAISELSGYFALTVLGFEIWDGSSITYLLTNQSIIDLVDHQAEFLNPNQASYMLDGSQ